ncbi:MAG: dihydrofolate reductase [Haloarcula sp.]
MKLSLVAAIAANGVIGADGDIPWHYPADLAHFKRTTVGHPVIMGRRTYESIQQELGGPLPERRNIVLTSHPARLPDSVVAVTTTDAAIADARQSGAAAAYVAGGATVYDQFLPTADELVLTELEESFDGDTTFPPVDWDRWTEVERTAFEAFDVVRYTSDSPRG